MNTATLSPGDLIRCNVRGQRFEAIFHGTSQVLPGRYRITPVNGAGYYSATARQIERRLERQERLRV